jgi:hypothetical protein
MRISPVRAESILVDREIHTHERTDMTKLTLFAVLQMLLEGFQMLTH